MAAAIAERWLPSYQAFSAAEDWGDPASLRRSLDAVWNHVRGRALAERDIARHLQQVNEITPHMDDFDAEEALVACIAVNEALQSCGDAQETIARAVATARGIFEGLIPEWPADAASEARVWKKSVVRKEVQAQLAMIEEIDKIKAFDAAAVEALRGRIVRLKVKAAPPSKPKKPAGLTNQALFQQYRRMIESDLKGQAQEERHGSHDRRFGRQTSARTFLDSDK